MTSSRLPRWVPYLCIVMVLVLGALLVDAIWGSGTVPQTINPGFGSVALMSDGAGGDTEAGDIKGQIFIVDSAQSFSKSEWELVLDNWSIVQKYDSPSLYYDRTNANHEKVTWNTIDATFLIVDPGTYVQTGTIDGFGEYKDCLAALIYTVDGKNYWSWSTACYATPCYGGSRKWQF